MYPCTETTATHVPVGLTAIRVVGVKKAVVTAREAVRSWSDFIMVASGEGKISCFSWWSLGRVWGGGEKEGRPVI